MTLGAAHALQSANALRVACCGGLAALVPCIYVVNRFSCNTALLRASYCSSGVCLHQMPTSRWLVTCETLESSGYQLVCLYAEACPSQIGSSRACKILKRVC